ncbi:cardiolipin synthase [Microbaculum marinisediminis]|uniref:Cardiolipin synthase n=1 Tax=Microbaculum marinisediminis TaxID=2931392 RepID=A0AAW5QXT0_9HYPH|nr:cardiolipin synthase [Microbaculum sp. A6E488]MCT8972513.1 cardiolipin synthase [Microbaculum sp. A6E488]
MIAQSTVAFLAQSLTYTAILHMTLVAVIAVRVIMKRPATGVALAWLFLVFAVPFGGAAIYLLIGERRTGGRRAAELGHLRADMHRLSERLVRDGRAAVDWSRHDPKAAGIHRLGQSIAGASAIAGSQLTLHSKPNEILHAIAADIDAAETSVLMEFYIWNQGGDADLVLEALKRAVARGVTCRVLVDALGGRPWWKGRQPAAMKAAGIEVLPALPVGPWRAIFGRTDLRLHRKIVVIDGKVGWTGSMNLVDPRFFKQDAGVGEWIDAMVRVEGRAVTLLAAVVVGDWAMEVADSIDDLIRDSKLDLAAPKGDTDIQVIASGPGETDDGLLLMLLALINAARKELILTTPYFVPDEALLRALRGAAGRGVKVVLVLPEKIDSFLSRHASRTYFDELFGMGVEIRFYRDGLLHTKSITVDGEIAMFGTVNLDMRSLWLNFEVSLFVYGSEFTERLRRLQHQYIADSDPLDADAWAVRPFRERFIDNTFRLVSPLL